MPKQNFEIGKVKAIFRYPVKSFAGEAISASWIGWHGLDGDRRFTFVKTGNNTGFPWLTVRDVPKLIHYKPHFLNPNNIRESTIAVYTPSPQSRELLIDSDELCSDIAARYGKPIHLLQNWSGIFDTMDISLISETTIHSIGEKVGFHLDVQRFRPNILVEAFDEKPFSEDKWIKKLLVFGDRADSARIRVYRKDVRCMIVNVDPSTAKQTPAVMRQIVQFRKNQLGVYGTTDHPGTIEIGDTIWVVER